MFYYAGWNVTTELWDSVKRNLILLLKSRMLLLFPKERNYLGSRGEVVSTGTKRLTKLFVQPLKQGKSPSYHRGEPVIGKCLDYPVKEKTGVESQGSGGMCEIITQNR